MKKKQRNPKVFRSNRDNFKSKDLKNLLVGATAIALGITAIEILN